MSSTAQKSSPVEGALRRVLEGEELALGTLARRAYTNARQAKEAARAAAAQLGARAK